MSPEAQKPPAQAQKAQPAAKAEAAPHANDPVGAVRKGLESEMTHQEMQAAIILLQKEVERLQGEKSNKVNEELAAGQPTMKQQAQVWTVDHEATDSLDEEKAYKLLSKSEDCDFPVEELGSYAVRGGYLVGVHDLTGKKVVVEHDLNVKAVKKDAHND